MDPARYHPDAVADPIEPASQTRAGFQETRWSVVISAGQGDSPRAAAALETLCRAYWPPLYSFIRRRGHSPEEAQDLAQEFFARFLKQPSLDRTSPEKGRFRSFLLAALKNFLINEWRREQSQKRGGGQVAVSLDAIPVESLRQIELELAENVTPETAYERHWAMTVLDRAMGRVRSEYVDGGKGELFELLKETLTGERRTTPRADLAARIGITSGAVDVAVHRLRRRYGEQLRAEIADLVGNPDAVEDEIRHLMTVVGRSS